MLLTHPSSATVLRSDLEGSHPTGLSHYISLYLCKHAQDRAINIFIVQLLSICVPCSSPPPSVLTFCTICTQRGDAGDADLLPNPNSKDVESLQATERQEIAISGAAGHSAAGRASLVPAWGGWPGILEGRSGTENAKVPTALCLAPPVCIMWQPCPFLSKQE